MKKISILYVLFLLIYLTREFVSNDSLSYIFALVLLLLVIQAFPKSAGSNRIISLVLFGAGITALITVRSDAEQWIMAFTANGGLVAFFLSLPLFAVTLSYKDYRQSINNLFVQRVRSKSGFLILVSWVSLLLSSILNVAADYMLNNLLRSSAKHYGTKHYFYQALARGNMGAVMWAPNYIAIATVVTCTGLDWITIAPSGFLLGLLYMLLSNVVVFITHNFRKNKGPELPEVFAKEEDKEEGTDRETERGIPVTAGSLSHLFFVFLGLILLVTAFNILSEFSIMTIIVITAIIYPLFLAVVFQKINVYKDQVGIYLRTKLPGIKNEVVLFAAIGFFGKVMDITGIGGAIFSYLPLERIPFTFLSVFVIIIFMAAISMIGVHPIVSVTVLSSVLIPEAIGLSPVAFAQMFLIGYIVAVTSSPFSAISLIISGISGENTWNSVPRWNICFNLVVASVFSILLSLL